MRMKKMLAVVSALCMMVSVVPVLPMQETAVISANAEDTYENLSYRKYADYIEITGYVEEPTGELVIPEEIDGLPVKHIRQGTFENCTDITSLTLPDTLTTIENGAFFCYANTKSDGYRTRILRSNNNDDSIGIGAFGHCTEIKQIFVSDTHPTLSSEDGVLFNKDKTELIRYPAGKEDESYTIPDTVTKISESAFSGCENLTSVTISESVTEIEAYAFAYCPSLTTITIPDGLTSIEYSIFCGSGLSTIIIPDSIKRIGSYAFSQTNLSSVTIPSGVTDIGDATFLGCTSLTSVTIPDGVQAINSNTFKECSALSSIVIPDSVTSLGESAFFGCSELTSITLPHNVTSIEKWSLAKCSNLDSIIFKNPNCEIEDSGYTIYGEVDGGGNIEFNGTLYGYEGSTAQVYAEKYGFKFALLDEEPDTTEPKTEELKQGDASGDGKINVLDVITINKAAMGKETLSPEQLKAIDFNSNGKPDSEESLMILKYIVGITASLTD